MIDISSVLNIAGGILLAIVAIPILSVLVSTLVEISGLLIRFALLGCFTLLPGYLLIHASFDGLEALKRHPEHIRLAAGIAGAVVVVAILVYGHRNGGLTHTLRTLRASLVRRCRSLSKP